MDPDELIILASLDTFLAKPALTLMLLAVFPLKVYIKETHDVDPKIIK
jgi:hypothetical protein